MGHFHWWVIVGGSLVGHWWVIGESFSLVGH